MLRKKGFKEIQFEKNHYKKLSVSILLNVNIVLASFFLQEK